MFWNETPSTVHHAHDGLSWDPSTQTVITRNTLLLKTTKQVVTLEDSYVWLLSYSFYEGFKSNLCTAQVFSSCLMAIILWIINCYHEIICCLIKTPLQKPQTTIFSSKSNFVWLIHLLLHFLLTTYLVTACLNSFTSLNNMPNCHTIFFAIIS